MAVNLVQVATIVKYINAYIFLWGFGPPRALS